MRAVIKTALYRILCRKLHYFLQLIFLCRLLFFLNDTFRIMRKYFKWNCHLGGLFSSLLCNGILKIDLLSRSGMKNRSIPINNQGEHCIFLGIK